MFKKTLSKPLRIFQRPSWCMPAKQGCRESLFATPAVGIGDECFRFLWCAALCAVTARTRSTVTKPCRKVISSKSVQRQKKLSMPFAHFRRQRKRRGIIWDWDWIKRRKNHETQKIFNWNVISFESTKYDDYLLSALLFTDFSLVLVCFVGWVRLWNNRLKVKFVFSRFISKFLWRVWKYRRFWD